MNAAAENLNFEHAAALRDQLRALSASPSSRTWCPTPSLTETSSARTRPVGRVRQGAHGERRQARRRRALHASAEPTTPTRRVLSAFVKEFYSGGAAVPVEVLLQVPIDDADVVRQWLSGLRGSKVRVITPSAERRRLVDLAAENAREYWRGARGGQRELRARLDALSQLAGRIGPSRAARADRVLRHVQPPGHRRRGVHGGVEEGKPAKSQYRRFRIRTVQGQNDFAMMGEVLR